MAPWLSYFNPHTRIGCDSTLETLVKSIITMSKIKTYGCEMDAAKTYEWAVIEKLILFDQVLFQSSYSCGIRLPGKWWTMSEKWNCGFNPHIRMGCDIFIDCSQCFTLVSIPTPVGMWLANHIQLPHCTRRFNPRTHIKYDNKHPSSHLAYQPHFNPRTRMECVGTTTEHERASSARLSTVSIPTPV